jgi:regulator of protease activity HflC (stomatin/prohibitin superfamily)
MIEWVFSWLLWAWGLVVAAVKWVLAAILEWARKNPVYVFLMFVAFLRMWGTTVRTGYAGVLFAFGRAKKVLEPGFHPMIPVVHEVRKLPVRSLTLDLPPQRLATADGLVYDIDATLVMRISDPVKATTQIDDLRAGCTAVLALAVAEVIRTKTREQLAAKAALDAEIAVRVQADLDRWGVTVEQAGLNTIAPTRTTTRLSQQRKRLLERADALRLCLAAGLTPQTALALLGPTKRLVGHSAARYHRHRPPAVVEELPVRDAPPPEDDEPLDDDLPI